jgi:hypothetical protein
MGLAVVEKPGGGVPAVPWRMSAIPNPILKDGYR